ncbi:MAG: phosphatidylglycerophosphatase A [Magnetospiraceae bacterium]
MAENRPSLSSPPILLATWFGAGYAPKAPGTWGSLLAVPFAYGIYRAGGPVLLLACAALVLAIGVWATRIYMDRTGTHDPGPVVIDEVVGQWIALAAVPPDWVYWGMAFGLFRFFDIVKPWPVDVLDSRVPGAWGVMLDDVMAGIYAALVVSAISQFV